uniref:Nucleoredoxin-like protein 2 n=1 Tax=Scolopendra viridis TaxID=118503 RepID=A0A4D5R9Z7_SCOVI
MDLLCGKTLVKKSGEEVNAEEALQGVEIIAFYFSAHWCPPCRGFTPMLAEFYCELKDKEQPMEIIFVSSDRSVQDMMTYMKEDHGDWLAIPYNDGLAQELKQRFNIRGIPSLVVVRRDGSLVTTDGRSELYKSGSSCYNIWSQKK